MSLRYLLRSFVVLLSVAQTLANLNTNAIPTLYDVINEDSNIVPLDQFGNTPSNGYQVDYRHLLVSVKSAEKDATMTMYEIEENYYDIGMRISRGTATSWTQIPGTFTRTYAMNQGASTLHISAHPSMITTGGLPVQLRGSVKDCSLDLEKKQGVCVEEVQLPLLTVFANPVITTSIYTSTLTFTYTRPLGELKFINGHGGYATFTAPSMWFSTLVVFGSILGTMVAGRSLVTQNFV